MTLHELDLSRRIELERADAKRQGIEEAIICIGDLETGYKNLLYRQAWKVAINSIKSRLLFKNALKQDQ